MQNSFDVFRVYRGGISALNWKIFRTGFAKIPTKFI